MIYRVIYISIYIYIKWYISTWWYNIKCGLRNFPMFLPINIAKWYSESWGKFYLFCCTSGLYFWKLWWYCCARNCGVGFQSKSASPRWWKGNLFDTNTVRCGFALSRPSKWAFKLMKALSLGLECSELMYLGIGMASLYETCKNWWNYIVVVK